METRVECWGKGALRAAYGQGRARFHSRARSAPEASRWLPVSMQMRQERWR